MDIHWRVTTRFTEISTWIYIGGLQQGLQKKVHGYTLEVYNKVYKDKYMDINWRVTTRQT